MESTMVRLTPTFESQGAKANRTGKMLEREVCDILINAGYTEVSNKKFDELKSQRKRIFARQYTLANLSVYNRKIKCDVIIYDPIRLPGCLVIECKCQKTKGTADEKMVYLVENIKKSNMQSIIVVEGEGFRSGVVDYYLPESLGRNLVGFFDLNSFTELCNLKLI
jgi:hypothetical protein